MSPKKSRYYTYIRPVMNNKFAKTYSSLIFSLITISIFSYYAIRPTVSTILSLQRSIGEQTQVLSTINSKKNDLILGKKNLEAIQPSTLNKLNNLIPNNPELPSLINSLTFAAEDAEASLSGLQFQPFELEVFNDRISKNTEPSEIDFTMNLQGEFNKLMNVLTTIKRLDRLIVLTSISFIQPQDDNLIMSVAGKAYYIKN